MKLLVNTKKLSHEEWLEWRKKGIGGSDVGAIVGANPWRKPINVYLDKIGEGIPIEENERMKVGTFLEEYVAKRFMEETGKKVRNNNHIMQHDKYDFMLANIDRDIVGENAILECKTTSAFNKKAWEHIIPVYYELQCHHYMAVGGYDRVYLAVLIGNDTFKYFVIERDEEIIEMLIERESEFWNDYVLAKREPPADGTEDYDEIIKERYPEADEELEEMELSSEYDKKIDRINELKELIKTLTNEQNQLEQEIKLEMGDYAYAHTSNFSISYKNSSSTRLDIPRLKKEKPELYKKLMKEFEKTSKTRRFLIK